MPLLVGVPAAEAAVDIDHVETVPDEAHSHKQPHERRQRLKEALLK